MGIDEDEWLVFNVSASSGLYEVEAILSAVSTGNAFADGIRTHDIMEILRLLGHPDEQVARGAAEVTGVVLTGEGGPCTAVSKTKAHRHAVPKVTGDRATEQGKGSFVDVPGGMHLSSLGGNMS